MHKATDGKPCKNVGIHGEFGLSLEVDIDEAFPVTADANSQLKVNS
jgi:hypothetical protein